MDASGEKSIKQMILVPSVITLGVTLLRLIGELQNWSPALFSRAPGGGAALVGIAWLPFVFGPYFALKLIKAGQGPAGVGKAIGLALLGLVVAFLGVAGGRVFSDFRLVILTFGVTSVAAIFVALRGWPALARILVAYGLAARIPVIVVMYFAIFGNWGTHYDGPAPQFPPSSPFAEWFITGVIPQITVWIAWTVIIGMVAGGVAVALTRKKAPAPATA